VTAIWRSSCPPPSLTRIPPWASTRPCSDGLGHEAPLARTIMLESSAIGVRSYRSRRYKLQRRLSQVTTPAGRVDVKMIYDGETLLRVTPEFDSCRDLSATTGIPLPEIYRLAVLAAAPLLEKSLPPDQGGAG